jgi:hypothetical protein
MATSIEYVAGAELPPLLIELLNESNDVINLTGFTGSIKLGLNATTTALTKTSGVTCSASGITVGWSAGDLALSPGSYIGEAIASQAGLDYRRQFSLVIRAALA